jgi:poly-gamma-glutamate system protein
MPRFLFRTGPCAGLLVALVFAAGHTVAADRPEPRRDDRALIHRALDRDAARLMARGLASIRRHRLERGLAIDRTLDPNDTGLVGAEFTPLTTSLGDVTAKRTAANPAFAAAVTRYFVDAGVVKGDTVAIGASGSFPALILATLCAARALELEPLAVYSIGSSMYGANLPGFTFAEMLDGLRADGILPYRFIAVAPGGDRDSGKGVLFDDEGTTLLDEARRTGLPMVGGGDLAGGIRRRLDVFDAAAAGRPIRCFVNIGGASVNYGATEASLRLPPGLVRHLTPIPQDPTRGLVYEFAARGVPVIHLLYVRGLAEANHLPYDPVPFPPVEGR